MNNCIVQFHISADTFKDPNYNSIGVNDELLKYSLLSVKQYAERIGADYQIVQDKRINWIHPTFERFDLFFNNEWWKKYEHILYLDTDLIIWPDSPDIFKMHTDTKTFKPCEDRIAKKRSITWHEDHVKNNALNEFSGDVLQQNRFNAGVFMLNKHSAVMISKFLDYRNIDLDDNSLLIYAMLKSGVEIELMDWRFNKKNGTNSWFGHAYGQQKFNNKSFKLLEKAKKLFFLN
jgi:hypothetical protein